MGLGSRMMKSLRGEKMLNKFLLGSALALSSQGTFAPPVDPYIIIAKNSRVRAIAACSTTAVSVNASFAGHLALVQ